MLRISRQVVAGLASWTAPRCSSQATACQIALLRFTGTPVSSATACFSQSTQPKDYALPNSSWSQDMMTHFNRFMEMCKDGTWERLPSYRTAWEHIPERRRQEFGLKMNGETRHFLRNVDAEGRGFEYAMFLNRSEKRLVCVFQAGPYLEGHPGFAHGGSIATILDCTFGRCAIVFGGKVVTANLNINYINPIPLRSVVLVESRLDKIEGRKLFIAGQVWSADRETLQADATAAFAHFSSHGASFSMAPRFLTK